MLPDVVVLEPVLFERPWGGRRLEAHGRTLPEGVPVGESWEVADLADPSFHGHEEPRSRILSPGWEGATLTDMIDRAGLDLLGSVEPTPEGGFPLLVKLLDAREHLSIQVHPHPAYAADHPEVRQKTESWYVVDADPGAEIFMGIDVDVPDSDLDRAIGTAAIVPMLQRRVVQAGDFHHVPAGRVHALGAGTFVLEVQTPSDTTFRIYDWSAEYGRSPRELHADRAREVIVRSDPAAVSLDADPSMPRRSLVVTPWYRITEHRPGGTELTLMRSGETSVVTVVRGRAELGDTVVAAPSSVVIPAASPIGTASVSEGTVVVESQPV